MVGNALKFLIEELNIYFKNKYLVNDNVVGLIHPNPDYLQSMDGHLIGVGLLHFGVETAYTFYQRGVAVTNQPVQPSTRSIILDLFLVLNSDNGEKYSTGLKMLDELTGYFENRPIFEHKNSSNLPEEIIQLSVEAEKAGLSQISLLTNIIGKPSFPCLFYKVRVTFAKRV